MVCSVRYMEEKLMMLTFWKNSKALPPEQLKILIAMAKNV